MVPTFPVWFHRLLGLMQRSTVTTWVILITHCKPEEIKVLINWQGLWMTSTRDHRGIENLEITRRVPKQSCRHMSADGPHKMMLLSMGMKGPSVETSVIHCYFLLTNHQKDCFLLLLGQTNKLAPRRSPDKGRPSRCWHCCAGFRIYSCRSVYA